MELVLPWLQSPVPLCKLEMVFLLKGKSPPELSVLYELEKVYFFSSWTQPSPRHIVHQVKCGLDVRPSLLPSPLLSLAGHWDVASSLMQSVYGSSA